MFFKKAPVIYQIISDKNTKYVTDFSCNVYFQNDNNMFVLAFLALVFGFSNACLEGQCRCYEKLGLIDCSHSGLSSTPHTNSPLENYTSISPRDNKLQHLNFTFIMEVFPQVQLLDVRDNSALPCKDIRHF